MYCFSEAVLTSIRNLCFGAKYGKIGITPVLLQKVGDEGVYISLTCFPGELFAYGATGTPTIIRIFY